MSSPLFGTDPFGGHNGFGFQVPQGDPGAIDGAASSARRVGKAFTDQGQWLAAASRIAVSADGGWTGTASSAYAHYSGELVRALHGNATACEDAATALSSLSRALSHAQAVTKQALADCERWNTEMIRQQGIAQQNQELADAATRNAASAPHPSVSDALTRQARQFQQQQGDAQTAAGRAQTELEAAERRGRHAWETYVHEARALTGKLRSAAGDLRTAPAPPGGSVPVPITASPAEVALAANLARQLALGKLKGPLINAVPASERTPGVISALLEDERRAVDSALHEGGARGPYGPWNHNQFLNPAAVNAMVAAGRLPPRPANWGSMTPVQRQQYLKALGPYFNGLTCEAGACTFVKATGTGTRSVPQVLHTLSRWGEYTAIGVCVAGSDGACVGAIRLAFVADSASNVANASSLSNLIAREGVTTAETVVAGGGGLIASKLGAAGMLDGALPKSALGKTALKIFFTTPSGVVTVIAPRIDHTVFPDPGPVHGHK